jgi:CpeT/CpcT family protein DUF1001
MDERRMKSLWMGALSVALLSLLAGCAGARKEREAELEQISAWLPGNYDNTAQVDSDKRSGFQPHDTLAVSIIQVYAPIISKHVFYAQEMAADNSNRVMSQRLLAFEISEDDEIVQSVWSLVDPVRFRDAHLNPDIFKMMQPPDVQSIPGCGLAWKKEKAKDAKPEHFTGQSGRNTCRSKKRGPGGSVLFQETRIELTPDELSMADQLIDSQGKLVFGRTDEPFLRFHRRAD